jgi:hypothetical protein
MINIETVPSNNTPVIAGYEPRNYSWDKVNILTGDYILSLDFII